MKKSFSSSARIFQSGNRKSIDSLNPTGSRSVVSAFRRAILFSAVLALAAPFAVLAQDTPTRARVTDRINNSQMTTLTGGTHPLARPQFDRGLAPADLPMNRMMLVLKRSPEQESALQDLLLQQQTSGSPNFHKWLTPEQFGQQFGPADADIQAVTSWLASFGFQAINVSRGRTVIEFSGTASQVQSAMHAPIHQYFVNGESHWANANDPQIPAALAPVISGFASLHNFRAKPAQTRVPRQMPVIVKPGEKPQTTFTDGSHGLGPADFNTIYHVTTATMTGNGVTIGVIADSNIHVQDVADFRSLFGLSTGNLPNIILNGPDPGIVTANEGEAVLDATWSGAVAPQATVDLVVSEDTNSTQGTDLSAVYIVNNNLADVMTESFSACEAFFSGNANFYSGVAEQAAAQGISFLVASGDGGPDSCDDPSVPPASTAASVNILASSWYTMGVGGTMFNDLTNPNTYWNANSGAGGSSAKSYIPENVWNESCTVVSSTCPGIGLWSSGGGQSTIFAKPPWQTGVTGIPAANSRFLPDVSLTSADHDGYIVCMDASCNGTSKSFFVFSGTSASVQAFGGVMAMVVQKVGRVGIANITLYNLAHAQQVAGTSCNASNVLPAAPPVAGCTFNDVTSGNTNIPGETGFTAAPGYDEATGLGSVNVSNLVNNWNTAVTRGSITSLTLNGGTAVSVTHGTSVPFAVTVAPATGTGTPTGDISLIANGITGGGADFFTLANGAVNSNTIFLPGGTYPLKAHYQGDGTFLPSDSTPTTVTITPEASRTTLGIVTGTPCTTSTTVAYGSPYILSVAVSDTRAGTTATPCNPFEFGAPPVGAVSLTDTVNAVTTPLDGGSFTLNSFGFFEDQPIQLPVGTHMIKATYAGDNSFTGSNSTVTVTVTKAATTTTVAANPTTVAAGGNVVLTATVATQSNAVANASQEPTGTVQFFVGGTASGAAVTVTGSIAPNGFAQATATLNTSTLANGANSITAKYNSDSNYAASATSPAITVTVGSSGINISPGCSSSTITIATPGQSGNCLISVTGANNFSGTVTLTCGLSSAPPSANAPPTCAFGPPGTNFTAPGTITLSAGSQTGSATLIVNTTAASNIVGGPSRHPRNPDWPLVAGSFAAMACLFLLSAAARKRRGMVLLGIALCAVIFAGTSCSSSNGGGSPSGNPGTTVGTYTITVTATPAAGAAQPTPITVVVN